MFRDRLLIVVELGSAACLTIGAAQLATWAGWMTAGGLGLFGAWKAAK